MLSSYGLYSHIRSNQIRSGLLIGILLALVWVLTFAFSIASTGLGGGVRPEEMVDVALWRTWSALPYSALGATAWVGIGFAFNREIATGFSGAEHASRATHPRLYNLLENLCISRGITMPRLEIMHTPALNAFASGMTEEQYTVTVTDGLLEQLTDDEIEAVLAHELTHIRNRDVSLMVLAVIIVGMIATIAELIFRGLFRGFWFPRRTSRDKGAVTAIAAVLAAIAIVAGAWLVSQIAYFALSRRREYLADAGAVELTKNPDAMIRALRKIAADSDIERLPSGMMHLCIDNPRKGFVSLFATHPSIDRRIDALVAYADGREDMTARPAAAPLGNEAKRRRALAETGGGASQPAPSASPWAAETIVEAAVLTAAAGETVRGGRAAGFVTRSRAASGMASSFGRRVRRPAGLVRAADSQAGT